MTEASADSPQEAASPESYAAQGNKRWYVVHAYSGMEKAVERNLRERIDRSEMKEKFGRILVPMEEVVELKNGKKSVSERRFFPGYVLVEMGSGFSALAAALVVGAVVAFYMLGQKDLWLRVAALVVLLAAAVATFFTSEQGRQLIAYGQDSIREVKKVVWPTRKEALQMTGYVFAFVVVMALFLWLTDKTLEWVLYDLVLGWKR